MGLRLAGCDGHGSPAHNAAETLGCLFNRRGCGQPRSGLRPLLPTSSWDGCAESHPNSKSAFNSWQCPLFPIQCISRGKTATDLLLNNRPLGMDKALQIQEEDAGVADKLQSVFTLPVPCARDFMTECMCTPIPVVAVSVAVPWFPLLFPGLSLGTAQRGSSVPRSEGKQEPNAGLQTGIQIRTRSREVGGAAPT